MYGAVYRAFSIIGETRTRPVITMSQPPALTRSSAFSRSTGTNSTRETLRAPARS